MRAAVRIVTAACAILCAADVRGQEGRDDVRVEVRVILVEGGVARVDRGAAAGIEPGDRIVLLPLGRDRVETTALQVDERATTVRFEGTADGVAPGVAGFVVVPGERLGPTPDEIAERVDGRPPIEWTSDENGWDGDLPLLADARALNRTERAPKWTGTGYMTGDFIRDRGGFDRTDTFSRLGLSLRGENVLGYGGTFRFDGEVNHRTLDTPDVQDEDETLGRLDRLSYSWGGTRTEARRVEFGRFLPLDYPELGLLDGAEISWRTSGGHRFGAAAGFLPSFDRERSTGDTFQVSTFGTFLLDAEQRLELGGALQKTWTDGSEDRDLALARLRWSPDGPWNAFATAWWDVYDDDAINKDSGAELTQLLASVSRRIGTGSGVSLSGSIVRYPELLRDGLQNLPAEILADGKNERVWLSGWTRVGADDRLRARIDRWSDQEASGGGGELGWEHRLGGGAFDRVEVSGFLQTGRFSDVYGARFGTGGPLGVGRWRADLDVGLYEQSGFSGEQEELLQNALRVGWDGVLGRNWFLSVTTTYRFGDEQDALALGFLLQRSF